MPKFGTSKSIMESSSGKRLALVVGVNNSSYTPPDWETLESAEKDASEIAYLLEQPECDFKLVKPAILGKNATASEIRNAMLELVEESTKEDFLLFYFSGHAHPGKNNEIFFVTDDFRKKRVELDSTLYLSMHWLWDVLYQSPRIGGILIILDCCYAANMFLAGEDLLQIDLRKRLNIWDTDDNGVGKRKNQFRIILAATGYNLPAEETSEHGQMTKWLLQALRGDKRIMDEEGIVDVYSIHRFLLDYMPDRQISPLSGEIAQKCILARHPRLSAHQRKQDEEVILHQILRRVSEKDNHPQKDGFGVFDKQPCEVAHFDHLDREKVVEFLSKELVRQEENLSPNLSDQEQLEHLGFLFSSHPTYGALLCFGQNPSQWVSSAIIRCIDSPGSISPDVWNASKKYIGGLLRQFDEACDFLVKRLDSTRVIHKDGSVDQLEIPFGVLREALANALIHREYEGRTDCIVVDIYSDRVEISSPGDLPRNMSLENLLEEHGSHPRNPQIAEIFHLYGLVEERGKGIERMRRFMRNAGLLEPKFNVSNDKRFKVTLYRPKEVFKEFVVSETFGMLLTQGIEGIAVSSKKSLEDVKTNLQDEMGLANIFILETWLQGFVAMRQDQIALLAHLCVKNGRMNKEWLNIFLKEAHYSSSEALIAELYPLPVPTEEASGENQSLNDTKLVSSTSNYWTAILLFIAAIGIPGSVALVFADKVSKNPWQGVAIALLYEIAVIIVAFLRKVWQLLEEEWSKDTATWVNNLVQLKWLSYSIYYCRFLTFQHRDFDTKGLSTQSIYTLELEQVFVDLSIDPKQLHEVAASSLHVQIPQDLLSKNHSLWTYLAADVLKNQQVVVLGAPGSGKTTLLKHLTLTLANQKKKQGLSRPLRHLYKLPFLLFLREHAKAIQENPQFSLVDAVEDKLNLWEREVPKGWVRHQLSKGGCLILLDGLDEVADAATRKRVVMWVEKQMNIYRNNRFIITSRPFGYRSNPLDGVMVLEVRSFTFDQIQQFVQNWYRVNEIMGSLKDGPAVRMRANAGAQDLLRRIQQTPALASLAVNPLLLTIIATIHRYRSAFPGKRVELYAEISDVFLGKRQQARGIDVIFTPAQSGFVLQSLAYEMMVRQLQVISARDAQEIMEESLRLLDKPMTPEDFLHMIENMSGLLLEREQGMYSFAHITFQEYFAATFIRNRRQETVLITYIGESWWEETIRLYCAQTDATAIIMTCLKQAPSSVSHMVLALECYEEAQQVQSTVKPQIDSLLEKGAEDTDVTRRNVVAEVLLSRRLKEMIPVGDGVYQDTSLLTHIEYQLFVDEQHKLGLNFQLDHWNNVQFPIGQALLPVVGVRPSDSEAFCRWLTQREVGVWKYRLPEPVANKGFPYFPYVQARPLWLPNHIWEAPIGYWNEKKYGFVWVNQPGETSSEQEISVMPMDLDMPTSEDYAPVVLLARTAEMYSSLSFYINLALTLALDLDTSSDLVGFLSRASVSASESINTGSNLASILAQASRTYVLTLANTNTSALTSVLVGASLRDRTLTREVAEDLARALVHASEKFLQAVRTETGNFLLISKFLALLGICMSFSAYDLPNNVSDISYLVWWKRLLPFAKKKRSTDIQLILNRGMGIYQKIERVERRIQGKEHACEGILIVKEREKIS